MARLGKRERIMAGVWSAVRSMIEPELARYRDRYPTSRRRAILEAMMEAARREDDDALVLAGADYFRLTRIIPPGCYAICRTRDPSYRLSGERIPGPFRGEDWSIQRFSPQVWR